MNRDKLAGLSALACSRLKDHTALLARVRAASRSATAADDRPWYRIEAKDEQATVHIYDEIGLWGTAADDFARDVRALDVTSLDLRINSPGGSVFDGIAIHNTLVNHPAKVHVTVDGVAASIASVIAMAGDTVTMGRGTSMMIHNPSGVVLGQAEDMREMADLLDQLGGDIAGFYSARAGGSVDQWLTSMAETTWYSAHKAVEAGLADSVLGADPPPENRDQAPAPVASAQTNRSEALRARHKARLEVCGK
jgi:ATP-dependent protease ClpP protease subunit